MDGLAGHADHTRRANRPRPPRETTAVPKLGVGLARLKDVVSALEFERARLAKRRADIVRERGEIQQSRAHIQTRLQEAGRELERALDEHRHDADDDETNAADTASPGVGSTNGHDNHNREQLPSSAGPERGLESLGTHS
jgi:hypothetical protein